MNKIPMSKAMDAIFKYLDAESDKIHSPMDKFAVKFSLGAAKANPSGMIDSYLSMLQGVGVVDKDGNVCVDAVKNGLDNAFNSVSSFEKFGFTFTAEDVPVFMRYMSQNGGHDD